MRIRSRRDSRCGRWRRFWSRGRASCLYFVRESLRQGGVLDALGAGCVLTGGGAMLPGDAGRDGEPVAGAGAHGDACAAFEHAGELVHPSFSAAVGMLLYAHRTRVTRAAENNSLRAKLTRHICSELLGEDRMSIVENWE